MREQDDEPPPDFGIDQVIIRGPGRIGEPGLETTHKMRGDDDNFQSVTTEWRTHCLGCGKNFHTARSIVATSVTGGLLCYECAQLRCRRCGRSVTKLESVDVGDEEVLCHPCEEEEGRAFLAGLAAVLVLGGIGTLVLWLVVM